MDMKSKLTKGPFPSGSLLCPPASRNEGYNLQLLPVDCNGVMLLSRWLHRLQVQKNPSFPLRWPITREETVLFAERIPWFHSIDSVKELAAQRGAFAATLKVAPGFSFATR